MADIQINTGQRRRKTAPPRVDLTPMVDLGFLLITFFIFTTSMTDHRSLLLDMPYNPPPPNTNVAYIESATLTIIPTEAHKVFVYHGMLQEENDLIETDYKNLRQIILAKQAAIRHNPASATEEAKKLHVIIKPHARSKYDDLVRILDEMLINEVPHYAIADITATEEKWLTKRLQ